MRGQRWSSVATIEHFLHLEQLRLTVLEAVRECGHTRLSVAEEAEISPRAVSGLLNGGNLPHYTKLRVWNWCDEWGMRGVWPEQAALATLVYGLPPEGRVHARYAVTRWYRRRLVAGGYEVPDWVADELAESGYLLRLRKKKGKR